MPYRDDTEGLRNRIGHLESELDSVHQDLATLRGEVVSDEVEVTDNKSAVLGAPTKTHAARQLDFELQPEAYEEIAALLSSRLGLTASKVGRALTCKGGGIEFQISPKDGGTELSMRVVNDGVGQLTMGAASAAMSLLGLLGLIGVAKATGLTPDHLMWMLPAALAGAGLPTWLGTRKFFRGRMERKRNELLGFLALMVEIAEKHHVEPSIKVQVPDAKRDELPSTVEEEISIEVSGSNANQA